MLFVVFLLTGSGLCAAEGVYNPDHLLQPKSETVNNTIQVLQNSSVLRLSKMSEGLARYVCSCLHSQFIKELEEGAERTLECYVNQNGFSHPVEEWAKLSTNVTISVYDESPYPVINMYDPKHMIPEGWDDYRQLIYANEDCFIMRTTAGKTSYPPCILFELDSSSGETKDKCHEVFRDKCKKSATTLKSHEQCLQITEKTNQQH